MYLANVQVDGDVAEPRTKPFVGRDAFLVACGNGYGLLDLEGGDTVLVDHCDARQYDCAYRHGLAIDDELEVGQFEIECAVAVFTGIYGGFLGLGGFLIDCYSYNLGKLGADGRGVLEAYDVGVVQFVTAGDDGQDIGLAVE
jgi:hypothetical protein